MPEIDPNIFQELTSKLKETLPSKYFILKYTLRNPLNGKGAGPHGIANRALIKAYVEGLELVFDEMLSQRWNRKPPAPKRVEVFVLDTDDPYTGFDSPDSIPGHEIPYIVLPSGMDEPLSKNELCYARIAAVHEGAHAINYRNHPIFDAKSKTGNLRYDDWEWVDEGIAVYLETRLLPGSRDHHRYLRRWVSQPEVPLNLKSGAVPYRAMMFIRFLDNLLKRPFANELWTMSKFDEDPFEAIKRLLPDGYRFLSDNHDDNDIFATYCLDSFFLSDRQSCCYDINLHNRFGERAISESFIIRSGQLFESAGELDHLACSYYKIIPDASVRKITVRLKTVPFMPPTPLRAQLVKAVKGVKKGRPLQLKPLSITHNTSKAVTLVGEMTLSKSLRSSHLILVVSNHGTRWRRGVSHNKDHDDDQKFTLEVIAE